MEAMIKGGALDANSATFDAVQWDRCARTDKGVSAACNFVSLNIRYERKPQFENKLIFGSFYELKLILISILQDAFLI